MIGNGRWGIRSSGRLNRHDQSAGDAEYEQDVRVRENIGPD
jgi:hypothetical protein